MRVYILRVHRSRRLPERRRCQKTQWCILRLANRSVDRDQFVIDGIEIDINTVGRSVSKLRTLLIQCRQRRLKLAQRAARQGGLRTNCAWIWVYSWSLGICKLQFPPRLRNTLVHQCENHLMRLLALIRTKKSALQPLNEELRAGVVFGAGASL